MEQFNESNLSFEDGTIINTTIGDIEIINKIGSGGQANVYCVNYCGSRYAMKLYFSNCSSERAYERINELTTLKLSHAFYLPIKALKYGEQVGYIMNILPSDYTEIANIYEYGAPSISLSLTAAINLCSAFETVAVYGCSFKDISDKNVFINLKNGDIAIIDTDNITKNLDISGISGTPLFRAPELVENNSVRPTRLTDNYSLAVLLFNLFIPIHPLEGNFNGRSVVDFDSEEDFNKAIYGCEGNFVFKDPNNLDKFLDLDDEGQVSAKECWLDIPKEIQTYFRKVFVDGLKNPQDRLTPSAWKKLFAKYLGSIYICPHCHHIEYLNTESLKKCNKVICPDCGEPTGYAVVRPGDKNPFVILYPEQEIYPIYFGINTLEPLRPLIKFYVDEHGIYFKNLTKYEIVRACNTKKSITVGQNDLSYYLDEFDAYTFNYKKEKLMCTFINK